MDSGFSLIEVAGEDDSLLLQQIPEDGVLNLDNDFLSSPLVNARSDGSNACSSTDCIDKENINVANLELPKLSVVPQQMKKKKGGYNLRKSLAWNRAFFTEEGVLNPLELSLITGSSSRSEALTEIDEETAEISGGDCCNDSSMEDKLFKDTATRTPSGFKKSGRGLLPKCGPSTKDNVKLKELSAKCVNRSASKRGSCRRPVASLAKGPTTLNTAKPVKKVETISRFSIPKRDPTVLSRIPRTATTIHASESKGNQVAQRVGSNSKKTTVKAGSINIKSSLKDGSASMKAKTSIPQPRKKLASPVLKADSSHSQHKPLSDSNKGLEVVKNSLISKFLPLKDHDGTKKASVSFPQNALAASGNMVNQIQMAKPSGLRMPSPSMGFFGQKRVASYESPLQSTSRPYDPSNNPNLRTVGPSNPRRQLTLLGHKDFVNVYNGDVSTKTDIVLCSSSGNSIEPTSCHIGKSTPEETNMHKGEGNVVGSSAMSKDSSIHGLENSDVISLFPPILQCENAYGIHDVVDECKPSQMSFNNSGVTPKTHFGDRDELGSQTMPRALNDRLKRAKDNNEQSSRQVECTNSSDCTLEIFSSGHQSLEIETGNSLKRSRISQDFEHGISDENVGNGSHAEGCCASDQDMYEGGKDAEIPDSDCCISNECYNVVQNISTASSLDSMHIDDEKPEVSVSNCSSLVGISFSPTSQCDHAFHSNEVVAEEGNGICGYESKSDIDLSLIPNMAANACLDSRPVVRNCNHHPEEIVDTINNCLELERKQDDRGGLEIACNIDVVERSPIARDICTSDTKPCIGLKRVENRNEPNAHVVLSVDDLNQLQSCCTDLVEVSQNNNDGKCLNDDLLCTSTTSKEYKEEIVAKEVIDNSDPSKLGSRDNHTPIASANNSLYEETPHLRMDNEDLECLETETSIRISSIAESSERDNVSTLSSLVEQVENQKPLQINGTILHTNSKEMEHPIDTEMCSTYNNCAEVQPNSEDIRNQNALEIKTSINSVPFSEEWLAAIEAAGEEILTMKSGAVQNSPPDKSQPEPSPWSPVKRKKNQEIGPFDCTKKHTNVSQSRESY